MEEKTWEEEKTKLTFQEFGEENKSDFRDFDNLGEIDST